MMIRQIVLASTLCMTSILLGQLRKPQSAIPDTDRTMFDPATVLWYKEPASIWDEALPVGNGRLGAMVYGNYHEENIQFNEDTYYSGGPYSTVVKGGYKHLPQIQKYLFEGEPIKAHKLFGRTLMGYPVEQQKYQSMGNIRLFFEKDSITDYARSLDLKTGLVTVTYRSKGIHFKREVVASAIDQTIAIRITADKPNSISFEAELRGVRNPAHSNYGTDYFRMDNLENDQLKLTGKSADYLGIEGKLKYEARLKALPEGGTMVADDTKLTIQNANEVTLFLVAATNFVNYKDVSANAQERVETHLDKLGDKSFDEVKTLAMEDHNNFFKRVSLDLPETSNSLLPTNERLANIQSSPDPQLASLAYNFGRYLLIASSRPGTQPANLQGIWNNDMNPAWDSKYTTNINTQMNYWPAETGNLTELTEPLFTMIAELTDQGSEVAREHYGARGWVFHQNTDLWRVAAPMDGPTWGTFTVGGAWLTTHMWEHYRYTQDKQFLEKVYPIMKGSVDFFMDFLIPYPGTNWLVTSPSNSPENPPKGEGYEYFYDEVTGMYYFTTIVAGATIDMQILKDLFGYYIAATEILNMDKAYAKEVSKARERLVPSMVGKDGTLQEWTQDYGQLEPNHRHFSPLYGLYPGNVISTDKTPELIEPVKKFLNLRGDGAAGWSRAWKMALWARIKDGDRANKIFKGYLTEQCYSSLFAICARQFQVDGSFGVTAGITEMLMQSHEGYIELLPSLPSEWSHGDFSGVCARGGFELHFSWEKNKLSALKLLSKAGSPFRLKTKNKVQVFHNGKQLRVKRKRQFIMFPTEIGETYTVKVL